MSWGELMTPPEWPEWHWSARVLYVVGLGGSLLLVRWGLLALTHAIDPNVRLPF